MRVGDGNAPTNLTGTVDRRVMPRPCSNFPHPVADGGEVHVRGGCVPPARDAETGVEVLDAGPREQGAPDGGACEFDLVVWPGCVADCLGTIVKGGVGDAEGELTERMPSAPTTRSAVAVELSLKVSSTPAAPRSVTLDTFFANWMVPGRMCESNAACSLVLCVRTGALPPPPLFFSRRCSSSPLLPFLNKTLPSALQPQAPQITPV